LASPFRNRPNTKAALVRHFRDYLHQVCHALGLSTRIVPHQLRHTYASEMLRNGVGLPAVKKILGHTSPEMTMLYLDVTLNDLQRAFELRWPGARPNHLPSPMFLYSVYVFVALAFGKYRVIDRSADPKGKLQLAVL
jgi:hypothetical protein